MLDQALISPLPWALFHIEDPYQLALLLVSGTAVAVFVLVGILLFSERWESYEEKYLEEAGRSLDDLLLTLPPQQLIFLGFASAFLVLALVYVVTESAALSIVFGAAGFFAPRLSLKVYKARRVKAFSDQLVDALGTLNNALRSGFALPKALATVAEESPKPLSQEFKIVCQELRLGRDLEEAMRNMHGRVPSEDLDLLITAIGIATEVGGNLTEVFDKIAHTIRERHRIEGRIDSLTAQGKMQGLVIGLLPLFLVAAMNAIDPEMLVPLYTTWIGFGVIALICVLEVLGFFFIRKICNIEV